MSKKVRCSFCGTIVDMRNKPYRINLKRFNVTSVKQLSNVYLCMVCRRIKRFFDTPEYLKVSGPYKYLKFLLQQEVNNYVKRGLNDPVAQKNFVENVKHLLDKRHIKEYDFLIANNELVGILLKKIPFFNEVMIELKSKGK